MEKRDLIPVVRYISTDLEVRSRSNLQPLADALERHLVNLYVGRHGGIFLATFEAVVNPSPDLAVRRFAAAVSKLPPEGRKLWREAYDRVIDIGFEETRGPDAAALGLKLETMQRISALNARVAITVYPRQSARRRKRSEVAVAPDGDPGGPSLDRVAVRGRR